MSEIGLLMTGVLTTRQPSLPDLPEQEPPHLENGLQNSIQSQLSQVVPTAQITPPEFMETDGTSLSTSSPSKLNKENLVKEIRKQLPSSPSRSQPVITDNLIVAQRQKYSSQSLPTIRFGSSGITVRVLQRLLIAHGYGLRVDGGFGPLTEAAVKAFQNRRNLLVDGIVGQRTWRELTI
jgi:peptidoglycan hydrolase-like protein with peptidoglycan-binding domain